MASISLTSSDLALIENALRAFAKTLNEDVEAAKDIPRTQHAIRENQERANEIADLIQPISSAMLEYNE